MYSSILAARVRFTPAYLPSQMARSLSDISALSSDMNLYSVHVELRSLLLCGAGSLLASTSEAHWPASPNSCMSRCLIIMPLEGVIIFNHIQMSTLDRLSNLSSSCRMAVGTPSGLHCHACSMDCMSSGVSSLIVKHRGFSDWEASCNHRMIACISCVCHAGAISFTTSTVSLKNGSVMGQRSNHCPFMRLVLLLLELFYFYSI